MDALLLTEPQATAARLLRHKVILDSRNLDIQLGAFVAQGKGMDDAKRQQQLKVFIDGYNQACDSLNKYGLGSYRALIRKYCQAKDATVAALPKDLKFTRMTPPREKDIERARKWLK